MLRYCHTLEVHTDFATLYLRGSLDSGDVELVHGMCASLPNTIRVLRLDASGLDLLDDPVRESLNAVVAGWRAERNGHVIVTGTRREVVAESPNRLRVDTTLPQSGSAQMATFL